jgi:hypothetical protein
VVAVWKGLQAAQAADQYVRFDLPYMDIPVVWVAADDGSGICSARVRESGQRSRSMRRCRRDARAKRSGPVVEGETTTESILVATHTDGRNAVEENGAIGLLDLLRMIANGLRPKRTHVFVFATGHLRIPAVTTPGGEATTAWLAEHPEWWSGSDEAARAVAALVLEHFGALAQPATVAVATGRARDRADVCTTATMQDVLKNAGTCWTPCQQTCSGEPIV